MRRTHAIHITDPYALRDALVLASPNAPALREIIDQLRPRPQYAEGGRWTERLTPFMVREHRVMVVFCDGHEGDRWERIVWPDEAHDALVLHMQDAHATPTGAGYDRSPRVDRVAATAEHAAGDLIESEGGLEWNATYAPVFTPPAGTSSEA